MHVRLSGTGRDTFCFLPVADLRIRGVGLWSGTEPVPLATRETVSWKWGHSQYNRIDLMGPLSLEFWDDGAAGPQATLGLFDRLYLINQSLFHRKFVMASFESTLGQWLCTSTGCFHQELRLKGDTKHSTAAVRRAMIQQAAYFNAERRGFSAGEDQADWFRAEAQIDAQLWYSRNARVSGAPLLRV